MKTKIQKSKSFAKKFSKLKSLFKSKKGSAIAISLTATGFMVLASIGASSIIISSFKGSTNVERNNNAFLVAESAVEMALFEISEHSSGFEVSQNFESDDHSRINLMEESRSEAWWSATSRDSMNKSSSMGEDNLVMPVQNNPNVDDIDTWDNWSEANLGTTKVIKLYSDSTSCAANDGKPCGTIETGP